MKIIDEYTDRDDLNYQQKWALRHPEKKKTITSNANKKNYSKLSDEEKSKKKASERERWNNLSQEKRREKWLKTKYKMSYDEYRNMYDSQNGLCYLCDIPISITTSDRGHNTACVDHDHETNLIRKLLCNHCNRAIGLLKERIEVVERLLVYLKEYKNL